MSTPVLFHAGKVVLHAGDCREVIRTLADASIDAVITDPPYALVSIGKRLGKPGAKNASKDAYARASAGFMGKQWDTGEAAFAAEFWAEVYRVLKPGGHVAAFSGTRTYHRLACAIEDAGFEIRDQLGWAYGTGFPKSHDVSKAIDKLKGCERAKVRVAPRPVTSGTMAGASDTRPWIEKSRERGYHEAVSDEAVSDEAVLWQGYGTALKPAWEPIALARKPLDGTVAENVLAHGTGALNLDACRVLHVDAADLAKSEGKNAHGRFGSKPRGQRDVYGADHRQQVDYSAASGRHPANILHDGSAEIDDAFPGGASRFFYSAKADAEDRIGSKHPTVKPVDLMQWLCRLLTRPGGTVLDPFAGTGTTGEAALLAGFSAVLIEREAEYREDIARRMALAIEGPATRKRAVQKARESEAPIGGLFGGDVPEGGGQRGYGRKIYGHFADQDGRLARSGSSGDGVKR